ncbi:MAG: glycosyltransferase family 2 protein [Spirochaetia bacterium]|nr:glycosyltransferase family 2 protein [Spirochaetia bacterium]
MRLLSVVLPTYNESKNIPILIERLTKVLAKIDYEILVVDDNSPDKTYEIVDQIASKNPRVRCIRRIHERGLSSAVMTGMASSSAKFYAVMDADLQHDEAILPGLLKAVNEEGFDLAVGSRAAEDGSFGEFSRLRRFISWTATRLAKMLLPGDVKDPLSGFVMVSREVFQQAEEKINPLGFKILLEFLGRVPGLKVKEVGYTFRNRVHGETKLSGSVIRNYIVALMDLRFGHLVSPIFILYCLVGASGILVYFLTIAIGDWLGMPRIRDMGPPPFHSVPASWLLGFALSVTNNYVWNNYITFYERRHKSLRLLTGIITFFLISLVGLLIQTSVSYLLASTGLLASNAGSGINRGIGIIVAVITNYYLNLNFTWRKQRR